MRNYLFIITIVLASFPSIYAQGDLVIPETEDNDSLVVRLTDRLDNALYNADQDEFNSVFNNVAFLERLSFSPESKKDEEFFRGAFSGLSKKNSLSNRFFQQIESSFYEMVNYSYNDSLSTYEVLYRMFESDEGINYHSYLVSKDNLSGDLIFNDVYAYTTGEYLSETLSRILDYGKPSLNRRRGNSIDMMKAIQLRNQGKYDESYEIFEEGFKDAQQDKIFLINKLQTAIQIGGEPYDSTMKEIAKLAESDTSLNILLLDYELSNENYDKALERIDVLAELTQDDFLDYLRGNVYSEEGNHERALYYYKRLIDSHPDFYEGKLVYVAALSANLKFNEATEMLTELLDVFEKTVLISYVEDLDEEGENALIDLAESEEFKMWKEKAEEKDD